LLQSELDIHVVVFVLSKGETITFQAVTIGHAAVTQVYLGIFGETMDQMK